MTENYIRKNIELSREFDKFFFSHPSLFSLVPNGATVVITVENDDAFNNQSYLIAKKSRSTRKMVEAQKVNNDWTIRPLSREAIPV